MSTKDDEETTELTPQTKKGKEQVKSESELTNDEAPTTHAVKESDDAADVPEYEALTPFGQFRRTIRMKIIQTVWFESLILAIIVINCVILALENPNNDDETLEKFGLYLQYIYITSQIHLN